MRYAWLNVYERNNNLSITLRLDEHETTFPYCIDLIAYLIPY